MRPIPATRLGDAHGLLRAIEQRGRLRTDEFVTEFNLDELFPPGLENALGRMRHFISFGRLAGLVKEDRGVVELTDIGKRYVRSGDPAAPYDISSQQAEWLRRQLRERHMTDSIFHGLAIGLSLLSSVPAGTRVATMDFGRSMAYLGRAGWDNENTLLIQGERHLTLLADLELIDANHRLTPTGEQVRAELTLPVHMSLGDIAAQLNPGGAEAVRLAAQQEFSKPAAPPSQAEPAPAAPQSSPAHTPPPDVESSPYRTVISSATGGVEGSHGVRPPVVPRPKSSPNLPADPNPAGADPLLPFAGGRRHHSGLTPGDPLASSAPPARATQIQPRVSSSASVAPPTAEPAESAPPPTSAPPASSAPAVESGEPLAAPPTNGTPPVESSTGATSSPATDATEPLVEPSEPAVEPEASSPPVVAPSESVVEPEESSPPPVVEPGEPAPVAESSAPPVAVPEEPAPVVESSAPPVAVPEEPAPVVESSAPPVAVPEEPAPVVESSAPPVAVPEEPAPVVESSAPPVAVPDEPAPVAESSAPPVAVPEEPAPVAESSSPPESAPSEPVVESSPPPVAAGVESSPPPALATPAPPAAPRDVFVDAATIRAAAIAAGLRLPPGVYANVAAALSAGKHVLLTGVSGAGKTALAMAVARAAAQEGKARGATIVTGDPRELIPEAAAQGRWVIVDELDQADPQATYAPLSSFLAGVPVTFATGEATPADDWRLIATWNGEAPPRAAILRRFAVIEVKAPAEDELRGAIKHATGHDATATAAAEKLVHYADRVGAGVLLDAARHAAARQAAVPTDPDTLAEELLAAYIAPLIEP
ncbi:hypothetical protein C8N24_1269 [Solirubrobacter pauli]|uniref:AAA+ ATPase domain-containing protein n=1 Tax=Solirubrobacter pauli TaxID=166793 RepID=A0A660L8Q6_9ACTN|nr:hypothetical protein [Solirubrobacter pauli]RKQ91447.1 hypothetical protein C8N24_1269 [Solirubrobacter pauli]